MPPYALTYRLRRGNGGRSMSSISMRELQKLSAGAIEALPDVTPVRNGERTVALLVPIRLAPADRVAGVLARNTAIRDAWTADEAAAVRDLLAERGAG